MIVSLDFETYSECDLKKAGAWAYSKHPSTKVLCVAYAYGDDDVRVATDITTKLKHDLQLEDTKVSAFNAGFEYAILKNVCKIDIPYENLIDSAAVAAAHSLPRQMGEVAIALDLPVLKDEEGKRVMQQMCKPDRNGKQVWTEEKQEILEKYCIDDVRVEREITRRLGYLSPDEQELWQLDLMINEYGLNIDMDLASSILKMKEKVKSKLTKHCQSKFGIRPSQVEKIKEILRSEGVEIPKVPRWKKDPSTGQRAQQQVESLGGEQIKKLLVEDISEDTKELLTIRREYATTSLAKADAVLRQTVDGIASYQFLYHGANTGRWAGKGIQLHNLPRGEFDEDLIDDEMALACSQVKSGAIKSFPDISDMQVLKSCLRGMVVPRQGHELVVMDFAQIEARVLPWLAGEQSVLDAFEAGKDLYKFTASQMFKKDYEDVDKGERFFGKMASLALGYGGGANAFISMAANFGVKVTKEEGEELKSFWRGQNPNIVEFWRSLQVCAIRTVKTGKGTRVGHIRFRLKDDFLVCHLPSGRKIKYYQPVLKQKKLSWGTVDTLYYKGSDQAKGIKWGDISTYGGKLSENVTQAVARDLLSAAMIRLHYDGYKIIGHVHDELILEVKKGLGKKHYPIIEAAMTKTPDWAAGLPVEADGFVGMRYRK